MRETEIERQRLTDRQRQKETAIERWLDGLLYNQWIDHNSIVGERYVSMIKFIIHSGVLRI